MKPVVCLASALVLALGTAVQAQDGLPLVLDRADVERGDAGVSVVVAGGAAGAPDRTRVRVVIRLEGGDGPQQFAEVVGGRFSVVFGPFRRRVLPGTYEVEATVDPSLQREDLAEKVAALKVIAGKKTFQVGTPEEAAAERKKLERRYSALVQDLRITFGDVDMWGNAGMLRAITERMRARGAPVPSRVAAPIEAEWKTFTDDSFTAGLATIRFDQQELGEFVLVSYFPGLDAGLTEIISTLDRLHAGYTVAIMQNIGRQAPPEIAAKAGFSLEELRRNIRALAHESYVRLGVTPIEWTDVDATPENLSFAQGDLYRTPAGKFEVRKPAGWTFNLNGTSPLLRIRMFPPEPELAGKVVVGVELRDHFAADNFAELAELDEMLTRATHPGFELKKIKRLGPPDATMPGGIRPGQEMRYVTVQANGTKFVMLQYALFCRWHKRTYTLMCIAQEGFETRLEETFRAICESFKVLDAPHQHGQHAPEHEQLPSGQ